jgi:hypothetical protein
MITRRLVRFVLASALLVTACRAPAKHDEPAAPPSVTASAAVFDPPADDAYGHRRCGPGVQPCSAAQSGQACNPNDLNRICTPQSNGSFCCLLIAH